ncbi:MAG TPA: hypothetical protein VFR97_09180 [Capillimicrobium sp.]|nr:hypothetical protein [Capillimicrobium sp.]
MQIEKEAQNPTLAPTVHAVAKPVTRAIAWSAVAAGAGALAAAAIRTLREP